MSCENQHRFTEKDIPDLSGYVIIVTGGNSGIGFETTKQLALRNARVYIASRSEERVAKAIQEMEQSVGQKLDLHFLKIDLQDLKSVTDAAARFMQQESRLDILINNAGIMMSPFSLTVDGFESQWQINALAPQIFSMALFPILMQTASDANSRDRVRIINVVSDLAFRGPKTIQLDDVNMSNAKGMMELMQRYSHSKQAGIRLAAEMNNRYGDFGISAYSLHPGIVRSNLQSSDPTIGAYNSLFCATSPMAAAVGRGKYFIPVGKLDPVAEPWINDKAHNEQLWNHCEAQLLRVSKRT
ncbi:hypothetical protein B0I35DRAFT_507861 [Stachybotrys elegans]|uniref:Uncharacterized protein n=1 Tax=Stachybotrys elegans TaxID=80388 RepID=A0A8K0WXD9_9HYPO|nr:hypothetical protein B0I35DRAFT_507861 [Stachybotrys elegans]